MYSFTEEVSKAVHTGQYQWFIKLEVTLGHKLSVKLCPSEFTQCI